MKSCVLSNIKQVTEPNNQLLSSFTSAEEAVERINMKFASFFQEDALATDTQPTDDSRNPYEWIISVSLTLVKSHLRQINPKKSMGSDLIPTVLYKEAADLLSEPLCHLFNLSINECRFPKRWKLSHVTPVPKKSPVDLENLRPIALLPVPSKILEKIILKSMQEYFMSHFGKNQFGSRPSSSTTCAVIIISHHALHQLESTNTSGVQIIAYDYSKAFDTLPHHRIIERMSHLHFPVNFVKWIRDYLSQRF